MRVELKGIHSTHVKLADGSIKIYWYAWRGGPRLHGEPGTPDFVASFNEAVAQRVAQPGGKLQFLLDGFQQSGEFRTLRERTRTDYIRQIKLIQKDRHAASFCIGAISSRENPCGRPTMHGRC
jgi:hypothetical protein